MTGKNALLDSNVIIYLSRRELDLDFADQFDTLSISVITYMEILGYNFSDQAEERFIYDFLAAFHMYFVDQEIAEGVIQIRTL
jgi:predicted nucleic acid-binding protein